MNKKDELQTRCSATIVSGFFRSENWVSKAGKPQ